MVNNIGQWKESKDYSTFQQTEWCDMDYMAAWIRSKGYKGEKKTEQLPYTVNLLKNIKYTQKYFKTLANQAELS